MGGQCRARGIERDFKGSRIVLDLLRFTHQLLDYNIFRYVIDRANSVKLSVFLLVYMLSMLTRGLKGRE